VRQGVTPRRVCTLTVVEELHLRRQLGLAGRQRQQGWLNMFASVLVQGIFRLCDRDAQL
jgi:hypothetical protein